VQKFSGEARVPLAYHLWAGGKSGDIIKPARVWKDEPSDAKKAVLIANNHKKLDNYGPVINSMDEVIRMNLCIGYGNEQFRMGQKTTKWACINAGEGAAPKFCSPKPYLIPGGRVGDEIDGVWFSRPKHWVNQHGKDRSGEILSAQKFRPEVTPRWPTEEEWAGLHAELQQFESGFDSPSTGMVTLYMAMNTPGWEGYEFYIVGFEHRGWPGHPFYAEKALMAKYVEEGKLHRLEDTTELP
jgi:hypothetical protein